MAGGIELIPEVPEEIKAAVDSDTLAVFIGAGVSRLLGCEGWDSLAKNLVRRCLKDKIINFKESETLSSNSDHKKTITICFHLFNNNGHTDIFHEEMKKSLKEGGIPETPNIYDDIHNLRGLFITTNADTHFDKLFHPPNILFKLNDFKDENLNKTNLYHIHGSINDKDSLVFTVTSYFKQYQDKNFRNFLTKIFNEYTVLFLGYGITEFEILDFILRDNIKRAAFPRHYMLSPFYKGEENILDFEQIYYNELGITVLGYEKDTKGFHQLTDILKRWNEEINQVTGYLHKAVQLIDEAVE